VWKAKLIVRFAGRAIRTHLRVAKVRFEVTGKCTWLPTGEDAASERGLRSGLVAV
jgi:hypothetical protein